MVQRVSLLSRSTNKGFTLLEVLIALVTLVVVMSGMVMALTSSMRLGTYQNQHSLAQDIARNVNSRWLKSAKFEDIMVSNLKTAPASYYGEGNPPYEVVLYDAATSPPVNALSTYFLSSLEEELSRLPMATAKVLLSPIRRPDGSFAEDKLNSMIWVQWGKDTGSGRRSEVKVPVVIGAGDVSRAPRSVFLEPKEVGLPEADEPCKADGSVVTSALQCCSQSAFGSPLICGVSAPTCIADGLPALTGASGCCSQSAFGSPLICGVSTPTCIPNGLPALTGASGCCSGNASGLPLMCTAATAPTPACKAKNAPAASGSECCSGEITGGGKCK